MNISEIFGILQIPVTRDEDQIRGAYHRLLTGVNPEDDPEGFKRLRRAYEDGLAYARSRDEETISGVEWLQDGETGRFLQRAADIYENILRRQDLEEWKSLLSDPVLQSLEDGEAAKWSLFSYLADHFYLPWYIWKLLDQEFSIQEEQKEWKEHLPEEFVDYLVAKLETDTKGNSFSYEKLRGEPNGDYDGFIREYMRFVNADFEPTEKGLLEKERRLEQLDGYGISHPWYDLEKARYQAEKGEFDTAAELVRKLTEENPGDEHIWVLGADILKTCGEKAEASHILDSFLAWKAQTPSGRFHALSALAELEAEEGKWERAKWLSDNARALRDTEELKKLQDQVHEKLIELYIEKADHLTNEEAYLLCRCFAESNQFEEAIRFFDAHPDYCQDTPEWHRQKATLNLKLGRTKTAFEETEAWRQCLLKAAMSCPDENEPNEELTWELALNAHTEAKIYNECYEQEKKKDTPNADILSKLLEQGLVWHDRALEFGPDRLEFLFSKMWLYRAAGEDRKVIDVCEQMVSIAPSLFLSYFYLQEAYENLRMPQEVVNTFYQAKAIFDGEPKIYLRAVRVFWAYRQYKDALEVIRQAEEAGAMNHELLVKKVCVLCRLVENKDKKAWREADQTADSVIQQMTEEGADPELLAEVYLERAYLNEDASDFHNKQKNRTLQYAKKSLELKDTISVRYFLGRFYLEYEKNYQQAYDYLKSCEDQGMEFSGMYLLLGNCQEHFKNHDSALSYYGKAIENDPDCRNAYWRMGRIWRNKCKRTLRTEYADKALSCFQETEERFGPFSDLFRLRAYLYLILRDYEKALSEASRGLELETDSGLLLLKGRALRMTGRYDEAVEYFEASISCKDHYGGDDTFCYGQIFQYFLAGKRFQEGIAYFEKVLESAEKEEIREECLDHMADYASMAGDYEQALAWVEKWYGTLDLSDRGQDTWERAGKRVRNVMNLWLIFQTSLNEQFYQKCREGAELSRKVMEDSNVLPADRARICQNVGSAYYYAGDFQTARILLEQAYPALENLEDYDEPKDLSVLLMKCCYWMGDLKKAKEYGAVYRKLLEKDYEECSDLGLSMEELLSGSGPDSRQRLYHLFCHAYYTGQYEKARHYAEPMGREKVCWWCREEGCAEEWEMQGMLAFLDQKYEEARKAFEQQNRASWLNGAMEAHRMLRVLDSLAEDGQR